MPVPYTNPQTGELSLYRTVEERLPEFLAAYPIADGWSVRRQVTAYPFSGQTLELIRLCLEKGLDPAAYGLAVPPPQVSVVAELVDAQERVRATATAFGVIQDLKDVETLETAALGRLMAAVGIGGSARDLREDLVPPAKPASTTGPARSGPAVVAITDRRSVPAEPPPPAAVPAPPAPAAPAADPPAPPPAPDGVPMVIAAQIKAVAAAKGVELPPYGTVAEAKQVLKDLRAL